MNYTANYHLPQWVKSDRIMMEDFNDAMSAMENSMTRSEGKADAALSTANAAQQTAGLAFTPSNMPYAVGVYVGNAKQQDFNLGFTPSVVMIFRILDNSSLTTALSQFCVAGQNVSLGRLKIIENGFRVGAYNDSYQFPDINSEGFTYQYIAFR